MAAAAKEKNQQDIEVARSLNNIPWCDDYEKMISGMLYSCVAPELESARFRARAWCHKYNTFFPDPLSSPHLQTLDALAAHRLESLKQIVGKVGSDAYIEPPLTLDYGCNLRLGERFYANFNCIILDCALVTIGDRVMLGPNVVISTATHEVGVESRRANIEYAKPIVIGDDCWIGGNVMIMPGVTIGDGCTIGAGSVVTRDIPSWSVALGTPARVVRKVDPVELDAKAPADFEAKERLG